MSSSERSASRSCLDRSDKWFLSASGEGPAPEGEKAAVFMAVGWLYVGSRPQEGVQSESQIQTDFVHRECVRARQAGQGCSSSTRFRSGRPGLR